MTEVLKTNYFNNMELSQQTSQLIGRGNHLDHGHLRGVVYAFPALRWDIRS